MSGESPLGRSEGIISYYAICTRKDELTREAACRFLHGIRIRLAHATNGRFRKVHFAICMTGNSRRPTKYPLQEPPLATERLLCCEFASGLHQLMEWRASLLRAPKSGRWRTSEIGHQLSLADSAWPTASDGLRPLQYASVRSLTGQKRSDAQCVQS
jgi:hypothetical protein